MTQDCMQSGCIWIINPLNHNHFQFYLWPDASGGSPVPNQTVLSIGIINNKCLSCCKPPKMCWPVHQNRCTSCSLHKLFVESLTTTASTELVRCMCGTCGYSHSHAVFLLWLIEEGRDTLLVNGSGCTISSLPHELKSKI